MVRPASLAIAALFSALPAHAALSATSSRSCLRSLTPLLRTATFPSSFHSLHLFATAPTMAAATPASSNSSTIEDTSSDQNTAPLALPATPFSSSTNDSSIGQLDLANGGQTVKLDALGPMVVNVDGSLSRISNWDKMTEMEQKSTIRVLGKRNKARLEALKEKEQEKEKEAQAGSGAVDEVKAEL